MPKRVFNDVTGKKFGRLIAIRFVPDDSKFSKFLCKCDCGVEKIILTQALIRGLTKSCGCYQKDMRSADIKHGHSGKNRSKTYNSWAGMMDRCEWGGHPSFARYGAAGIRVDPLWHSFEAFLSDMGERPIGTSIDRIDNEKGYAPGNCRWADRRTQALNRSNTIKVIYEGEVVPVFELCERVNISKKALRSRAFRRSKDYVSALASFGINVSQVESTIERQS